MKQILLVDDDRELCAELKAALARADSLSVSCAHSGAEAMAVLSASKADLVITDLQMPEMNGFALVAYISQHHPGLPVVILSAFATSEAESRLRQHGVVTCLEKPVDPQELVQLVFDTLRSAADGRLRGISLAALLQLLEMERKTCTLYVSQGTREASLYLVYGKLFDAVEGEHRGESVAREVVGWDENVAIAIEDVCRSTERTIEKELRFLIMDSLRRKDEQLEGLSSGARDDGNFTAEAVDLGALEAMHSTTEDEETVAELAEHARAHLLGCLETFGRVHGYQASAIMNTAGKVLVSHVEDTSLDLDLTCRSFNEALRSAQRATARVELVSCDESVFRTRNGIVLTQTLRPEPTTPIQGHLVVVFSEEVSEGMMKMRARRVVPEVLAEFARAS